MELCSISDSIPQSWLQASELLEQELPRIYNNFITEHTQRNSVFPVPQRQAACSIDKLDKKPPERARMRERGEKRGLEWLPVHSLSKQLGRLLCSSFLRSDKTKQNKRNGTRHRWGSCGNHFWLNVKCSGHVSTARMLDALPNKFSVCWSWNNNPLKRLNMCTEQAWPISSQAKRGYTCFLLVLFLF